LSHTAQYRGHVEGTRTLPGPAAAQHACARCNATLHLLVQRIAKVSACHRPHLSSGGPADRRPGSLWPPLRTAPQTRRRSVLPG
jgi:hypothetical protein